MDICLLKTKEFTQIKIRSVHGMLWMQTHFEESHWEFIANDQITIPNIEMKELIIDAEEAGINLNYVSEISTKISKL